MKKVLLAIALFASYFFSSLPAAGQYSLDDRLLAAAYNGNADAIQPLLDKGANIDARNYMGNTALFTAAINGKIDMMKLLLDKGASINARGFTGETALGAVVYAHSLPNEVEVLKLLMDRGADIEAKDAAGQNALYWANRTGPAEVVDILEQATRQRKLLEDAQAKEPNEKFAVYVGVLQRYPQDASLREKIIQLGKTLPAPPAISEEANQLFVLASAQIKQAGTPASLDQPIGLLREVLNMAPCWANAYYNLSRALEMRGQYGDAIEQLKYYLELNQDEVDASDARARIEVLRAEESAARPPTK